VRALDAGGTWTTVAGNGLLSGESSDALHSSLGYVSGLAAGPTGDLVLVDDYLGRVLIVKRDGSLSFAAGAGDTGTTEDGGPAWAAKLAQPTAAAVAAEGSIFVVETGTNRIRLLRR
jgi:hypothetical protein